MQVQLAQNTIFRELEDYFAAHTRVAAPTDAIDIIPQINEVARNLGRSVRGLERVIGGDR